ncbi:hypothetical protein [Pseudomonas sp. Marseille-Q0931]|uniref:hypothetical protein n=1 Tax=Pseudomonas sp. Marseille-Q0931 TaxID=2697507 RepID=UPI0023B99D80|nr:hypothetical protein [Pseudomonas sp. Marseille-Q0931]
MSNQQAIRPVNAPGLAASAAVPKALKARSLSPTDIIERNLENIRNAHPALVSLMEDRAEGALQALCSLGLIDGDTYLKAGLSAFEAAKSRSSRHAQGVSHA